MLVEQIAYSISVNKYSKIEKKKRKENLNLSVNLTEMIEAEGDVSTLLWIFVGTYLPGLPGNDALSFLPMEQLLVGYEMGQFCIVSLLLYLTEQGQEMPLDPVKHILF